MDGLINFDIKPFTHHALGFILVALCWGLTNPFIKLGSKGLENIKRDSWIKQILAEFIFLFTRWQYVIPLALNLSGSLVYYYTLGKSDLSLAVPIANSLTFVFTFIGEKVLNRIQKEDTTTSIQTILGVLCVCLGVGLCVTSKL